MKKSNVSEQLRQVLFLQRLLSTEKLAPQKVHECAAYHCP